MPLLSLFRLPCARLAALGRVRSLRARVRSLLTYPLTFSKIRDFAGLVLGEALMDELPHPQADLNGFVQGLERTLARTPAVWDPLHKRQRMWMNAEKIRAAGRRESRRHAWENATGTSGVVAECSCAIA